MQESVSRGLKPSLGRVLMSGLKPGPISEAKATARTRFVRGLCVDAALLLDLFHDYFYVDVAGGAEDVDGAEHEGFVES